MPPPPSQDRRAHPRAEASFIVRIGEEPDVVQAAARDIGAGGIFVRCASPPRVGVVLVLELHLPDGAPPMRMGARVLRALPRPAPGEQVGFAAQFVAPGPEAQARIARFVARAQAQRAQDEAAASSPGLKPVGAERRNHPRYRSRFRVHFPSRRDFVVEHAENISRGGIFVRTTNPAERDAVIDVRLELPDGGPPADAVARVVFSSPQGMGCQFIEVPEPFRARLDAFLERLAREDDPL